VTAALTAGRHAFAVLADGGSTSRLKRELLFTTPQESHSHVQAFSNHVGLLRHRFDADRDPRSRRPSPPRGGYHGGGYHGGGYHGGWYRPRWSGHHYYTRYYYPPTSTYVPSSPRYLVPPEYAGTPAGYLITYGGVNYMTNGDGTMSPN
jgi:hypothetical protein